MGKLKIKTDKDIKNKFYSRIDITACMIVKDEIDNIQRCLDSIQWADDIVVVDTGSTDGTLELIREKYPKIRLYESPWEGSFSQARNESLKHVKTNYVLIIDADEVWVFEAGANADTLKKQLLNLPNNKVGGVKLLLEDMVQGSIAATFKPIRLFTAKANLKYRSTVHNEPIFKNQVAVCSGIKLLHFGYDVPTEKAKMKVDRTAALLMERLEADPNDYEAIFYLMNIYSAYVSYADLEKTLEWAEVYFQHLEDMEPGKVRRNVFYSAAETARRLKDLEAAERWVLEGKKRYPKDLDLNYAMMLLGINLEKPEYIMEGAMAYIQKYEAMENNPLVQSAGFVFTKKPMNLMNAFHKLGIIRIQEGLHFIKIMDNMLAGMSGGKQKMEILKGLIHELKVLNCESVIKILKSDKII
ncbi:MAG: glycosyltransferase family 2 protein [Actinomycetia bacterium]|nr:glycosyltransferase family 2 protein [Actinomycetes bacterium]